MIRVLVAAAAAALLTACNSGAPTEQEQNLPERASGPEQLANSGVGNITPGTLPPAEQNRVTAREPEAPGGPRGNRGSGTGGDSVPSQ